jgi:hypothetical protein
MDDKERLKLDEMLKENNVENMTTTIRDLKHSSKILEDVKTMISMKKQYSRLAKSNPKQYESMVIKRCNFLFTKYTNIYNRLYKDQLDIGILLRLINVLKNIEEGDMDQHEGSFAVGKILKEMYIDSALKQEDQRDKSGDKKVSKKGPVHKISWKEFALMESE